VAVTVVMVIRVVGLILVIALLTIPSYLAERFSSSLGRMMLAASLISMGFCITGLWAAYVFNFTSGASIIAVATLTFLVFSFVDALWKAQNAGVEPTPKRLLVLREIAGSDHALSAPELLQQLEREKAMNKVTLYRTLDLLVQKGILLRHSVGDRAYRYCLGSKGGPRGHCHFFCTSCGRTECLALQTLSMDLDRVEEKAGGHVQSMEIRLDGICRTCWEDSGVRKYEF
jgi:Fe2+ or Zn2+ uptake regulation protein